MTTRAGRRASVTADTSRTPGFIDPPQVPGGTDGAGYDTPPSEPMVIIPKANAIWLHGLMDQLKFAGSDAKQEAAVVQRSLEQVIKE